MDLINGSKDKLMESSIKNSLEPLVDDTKEKGGVHVSTIIASSDNMSTLDYPRISTLPPSRDKKK
jgi:hypothetical protein